MNYGLFLACLAIGLQTYYANGQNLGTSGMKVDPKLTTKPMDSVKITVDFESKLHVCGDKFLSICIDSSQVTNKWKGFDFDSPKLKNMAVSLSPINIRIGGTSADYLIFDPSTTQEKLEAEDDKKDKPVKDVFLPDSLATPKVPLPAKMWDNMTNFFAAVRWDLMFDFNVFLWKDGLWDSSNAELLLKYSAAKGVPIPNFQLGNEPNLYKRMNITITPEELLKDFKMLKNLISNYPMYKNSGVFGPDVTNFGSSASPGSSNEYLQRFLEAGAADVVDEITFHHYYTNGATAKAEDFYNVELLDSLKKDFDYAFNITRTSSKPVSLRLSETSSCYGGGAPNLSDRYLAGFLWLDKLGLAAKYGITNVFRQAFYGGNYALVSSTLDPNPDYFLTLLYKRLLEGPVFNVTVEPASSSMRVYAHCTRVGLYEPGSVTLYYLNLQEGPVTLSLSQFKGQEVELYLLTPGDSDGLTSKFVKLNGEKLEMQGSMLPLMPPKPTTEDITVEGRSFGFVVVPNATTSACKEYFEQKERERYNINV